jgi:hypothetical protein
VCCLRKLQPHWQDAKTIKQQATVCVQTGVMVFAVLHLQTLSARQHVTQQMPRRHDRPSTSGCSDMQVQNLQQLALGTCAQTGTS